MDSVTKVKELCKEKRIPISRLEKDCGFSNGYIGGLKKGKLPSDRLQVIADYLDTTVGFLLGDEGKPEYYSADTLEIAQKIFEDKELRLLFFTASDADPEDIMTAHQMLLALKRKERHHD